MTRGLHVKLLHVCLCSDIFVPSLRSTHAEKSTAPILSLFI
jgi:hypothetical protein